MPVSALAGEPDSEQVSRLWTFWNIAKGLGKPLLILEVAREPDRIWDHMGLYGDFLQLASEETLAELALCEVCCASIDSADAFTGAWVRVGQGQLSLVESAGDKPGQGQGVQWSMGRADVPWDFDGQELPRGSTAAMRNRRLAGVLHSVIGADEEAVAARAEACLFALGREACEGVLDRLRTGADVPLPEIYAVAGFLWARAQDEPKLVRILADTSRERLLKLNPPGARWVTPTVFGSGFRPGPSGGVPYLAFEWGPWLKRPQNVSLERVVPNGAEDRWTLGEGASRVRAVAPSADGKVLAVAADKLHLFDVALGWKRMSLDGHRGRTEALGWHPEGRWLISRGTDGKGVVWDTWTGAKDESKEGFGEIIRPDEPTPREIEGATCYALSADKTLVFAGYDDGSVVCWRNAEQPGRPDPDFTRE